MILSKDHPIWLAGFRPFFLLAILSGIILPLIWGLSFSGTIPFFLVSANPILWHAHEMFFAFGGAVLIGFLLTASKNWVRIRGVHGSALMIFTFFWIQERFVYHLLPFTGILWWVSMNLFLVSSSSFIFYSLYKHRQQDTFKDNAFFMILLPILILAKNLHYLPDFTQHSIILTLGVFRLAFALMFERTLTQFMKNTEGVSLYRNFYLDIAIKLLLLASIFQSYYPQSLAAVILFLTATLLLLRFLIWKPHLGFKKFGNGVMYLGYLGLTLHLYLEAFLKFGTQIGFGAYSMHIFTFLCMGIIIPAMFVRISQGHTGRKPEFLIWDKLAISCILFASFFRLIATQLAPEKTQLWIMYSGVLWSLCFALLAIRFIPMLLQQRIDGKIH